MEHTHKNILIRAVKKQGMKYGSRAGKTQTTDELIDFLQVDPTLRKLLERE